MLVIPIVITILYKHLKVNNDKAMLTSTTQKVNASYVYIYNNSITTHII